MRWITPCLLVACGSPVRVEGIRDTEKLSACARGDVARELAIVSDLEQSYHEMIVCGGLQLDFTGAISGVAINAALSRKGPPQLEYAGNGRYTTPNNMMTLQTSTPDGKPLAFDALDVSSYFTNAKVSTDVAALLAAMKSTDKRAAVGKVEIDIAFDGTGPGFALLGVTADNNKVRLTPERVAAALGSQIAVANEIAVESSQGGTHVAYHIEGKPQLVQAILDKQAVPMELSSITATRDDTKQSVKVTEWTMAFDGKGGQVLDGTIGVDVDGGAFPYHVRYTYRHDPESFVDVSCR